MSGPIKILTMLLFLFLGLPVKADSPLTGTDFWQAYQDVPEVMRAREHQALDEVLIAYLMGEHPIDHKAAVINALSWNSKVQPRNFVVFEEMLAAKYDTVPEPDKLVEHLTAHEAFCLGYINAMDQYTVPSFSLPYLYAARRQMPRSFTVAMLTSIVEAQDVYDQWEKIWPIVSKPTHKRDLVMDMRPAAKEAILAYLELYKEYAP